MVAMKGCSLGIVVMEFGNSLVDSGDGVVVGYGYDG